MRKLNILLILCIFLCLLLLPHTANCQWYQRQYGVENLTDLTQNQVHKALAKADWDIKWGRRATLIGLGMFIPASVTCVIGTYRVKNDPNAIFFPDGWLLKGWGLIAVAIGAIPTGSGLASWIAGSKHKNTIESTFSKKLTQISISPSMIWHQNRGYLGARISFSLYRN